MAYLLNTVETYQVATEQEALNMREAFSNQPEYELESFSYTCKYDKKADEDYVVVKVKKFVNKEKDCKRDVMTSILPKAGIGDTAW